MAQADRAVSRALAPAALNGLQRSRGRAAQKAGFRQPALGACTIAGMAFAALGQQGPDPIARQTPRRVQTDATKVLAPDRLDRVTPDPGDASGHFPLLPFFSPDLARAGRLDLILPKRSGRWPCIDMIAYCCAMVMVLLVIQ